MMDPPCEHAAPWIEHFDCGCEWCPECKRYIDECAYPFGPDCWAEVRSPHEWSEPDDEGYGEK
jgi:hypothetical protein